MTIIVEDGTIVANANSYVSEADLTTFATARGITLTADTEQLLIKSMDYVEALNYKGIKQTRDQSLVWPRYGVYVDGYYLESNTIPQELKDGQMQCAIAIDQGNDPLQDIEKNVKREKVGNLEIEYADNSVNSVLNKRITNALKKLLIVGSGTLPVYKG
jgi:hypothetical protein